MTGEELCTLEHPRQMETLSARPPESEVLCKSRSPLITLLQKNPGDLRPGRRLHPPSRPVKQQSRGVLSHICRQEVARAVAQNHTWPPKGALPGLHVDCALVTPWPSTVSLARAAGPVFQHSGLGLDLWPKRCFGKSSALRSQKGTLQTVKQPEKQVQDIPHIF